MAGQLCGDQLTSHGGQFGFAFAVGDEISPDFCAHVWRFCGQWIECGFFLCGLVVRRRWRQVLLIFFGSGSGNGSIAFAFIFYAFAWRFWCVRFAFALRLHCSGIAPASFCALRCLLTLTCDCMNFSLASRVEPSKLCFFKELLQDRINGFALLLC